MTAPPPPDISFSDLPPEEQARIRTCGVQMIELARQHARGLILGPSKGGPIETASYCVMEKDGRYYLITAAHVYQRTEEWMAQDASVRWQAGELVFDPLERVCHSGPRENDVILIELGKLEATMARVPVCSTIAGWPPPAPRQHDYILAAGYPAVIRERPSPGEVNFRALAAMLPVTTSGDAHLCSQWDRENMIHFSGAGGIPPSGIQLGGMSGGPVFLVRQLDYPLVGVVTDFQSEWELMRLGLLSAVAIPQPSP